MKSNLELSRLEITGLGGCLTPESIARAESELLRRPQVQASVIHRFGAGVYIRELHMPAVGGGTMSIGRQHRLEHWNIMLAGHVTALLPDGTLVEYKAPLSFLGKPGKKIGIIHEDMIWQNIFVTNETDVAKLEEMLFEPSSTLTAAQDAATATREDDRQDYIYAIESLGVTEECVKRESENESDMMPLPQGSYKFVVSSSGIQGKGMFATADIRPGELIAPANIDGRRTPAGRYANHAERPNARMVLSNGNIYLVATEEIFGSRGGLVGDEITVCYRDARATALTAIENKKLCQQQ